MAEELQRFFALAKPLHDYKEISKFPCLTCVTFSAQCGGTRHAEARSVRRILIFATDRATENPVELRQSERLERFSETERDTPDRFACRFQRPLRTTGIDIGDESLPVRGVQSVHTEQRDYAHTPGHILVRAGSTGVEKCSGNSKSPGFDGNSAHEYPCAANYSIH